MLSLFFEKKKKKKKEKITKKLLYTYTLVVMVHYSNVFFSNSSKVNGHFSIVSHCNQDDLKAIFFKILYFFTQNAKLKCQNTRHKLRPQKSQHHYKKHNVTEASILSAGRWTKVVLLLIC